MLNGEYYILTPSDSLVIRRMSGTGKVTASFARQTSTIQYPNAPEERARTFRIQQNRGELFCDAKRNRVILVHREVGLIRAFGTDGLPIWETRMANFNQVRWVHVEGTRYMQSGNPKTGTATFTGDVHGLTNDMLAVTIVDRVLRRGGRVHQELRLFSLDNGRELKRMATPYVIVGLHQRRLYGFTQEPYPRILVFEL